MSAKKFYMKIRNIGIGPGGWMCACCAPSPLNRPKVVRARKKLERRIWARIISEELNC